MRYAVVVVSLALVGSSCVKPDPFGCADDDQCTEGALQGACESSGFCSLPDTACPSGRRYDEAAGDGLAGECVDGRDLDAGLADANLMLTCADWSYEPTHFGCADLPLPVRSLSLTAGKWSLDTDSGEWIDPQSDTFTLGSTFVSNGVRYFSLGRFDMAGDATLRATGSNALVIVSWSDADLAGTILVNSERGGEAGAGANPGCSGGDGASSAGGGGAGFGTGGGNGGAAGVQPGGSPGGAIAPSIVVRGGCAGGVSVRDDVTSSGGRGGGAVQITARTFSRATGSFHAGGEGGAGGLSRAGGGGGGSGGFIGLEAPQILIDGAIFAANGGGGGSGAIDDNPVDSGADGDLSALSAAGGNDGTPGGQGGAAGPSIQGEPGDGSLQQTIGGGGGGGGAGFVVFLTEDGGLTTLNSPVFSPGRRTSLD